MTTPWRSPLDVVLRDAYLARLGWSSPPPSTVDTLHALHRAHVERVPYEVVWIALGERRTIAPLDSVGYLVAGRGGYCYHLNGAFGTLLQWLGFDVRWRVAGVQGGGVPQPQGATGTHLTVEVHGLPSGAAPHGVWLVDVGLGNALHEPIPLMAGRHRQGPFTFGLRPSEAVDGGWRFDHFDGARFSGMDFAPRLAVAADFVDQHHELSTSPDSGFVRVVTASRVDATGIVEQRGLLLERTDSTGVHVTELTTRSDWFASMADNCRLPLSDVDEIRRAALWSRLVADHEHYLSRRAAVQ
ncbi:MAG: arylamine N-acetyltransferase [Actinomycetota bacterium]|nr:arylamine N-acetyltransferase [Actinomycetota bacterium]